MNKTESRKALNKLVFEMVTGLGYEVVDDGDGGRVTFIKPNHKNLYDSIEYHRSYFDVCVLNDASNEVKEDGNTIEWFIETQRKALDIYNTVFNNMTRQIKKSNIIIIYCDSVLTKLLDIPFFNKYNLKLIKIIKFPRFVPFTNNILYILSN